MTKMSKQIGRNEPCWCGSGRKYKVCHAGFDAKIESYREQGHIVPPHHIIKTPAQIEQIKESCKINIAILDYLEVRRTIVPAEGSEHALFLSMQKK